MTQPPAFLSRIMLLHSNKTLTAILGFFLLIVRLPAQEARPEPGTANVPSQNDPVAPKEKNGPRNPGEKPEGEPVKLSYIRIWNFAGRGDAKRIGVFLRKKGDPGADPVWLGRGVRYGTLDKYREVPEGSYELLVVSEPGPVDPEKPIKFEASNKGEVENVNIVLKENGYQTLLIQEENKSLKAVVLDDLTVKAGMFTLRAANYTDSNKVSIVQVVSSRREPLFAAMEKDKMQIKEMSTGGRLQVEMVYYDEQGFPMTQSAEIDPSSILSSSMVVYYDRYGRVTFRCLEDAPRK